MKEIMHYVVSAVKWYKRQPWHIKMLTLFLLCIPVFTVIGLLSHVVEPNLAVLFGIAVSGFCILVSIVMSLIAYPFVKLYRKQLEKESSQ